MIRIKKIVFCILLLMFFLPYIQKKTKIIKLKPLKGFIVLAEKPEFSYKKWLSGEYQTKMNKYIEQNIGFRSFLIRINNQIAFNISKVALANGVIFGKDNYLFEWDYIPSLWGEDFIGDSLITQKVSQLAFIQNKLKEKGKHLVFLIAPSKASIYEEKIPSGFFNKPKNTSNYDVCVREMKKNNINLIDMRSYLKKIKDKSPYPLFPRCGTHWSGYCVTLVADTLFKFMEKISGIDLVDFHSEKGETTSTNFRFTDNDIGDAMNLLWNIPNYPLYYPKVVFTSDSTKKKPAVLSIGDSFNQSFWGFYPYFSNLFDDKTQYWYYFKVVSWPEKYGNQNIQVEDLNIQSELSKFDIILIVSNELNLAKLGFGFIEKVYPLLYENKDNPETKPKINVN